jgi:hypothetical protein
MPLARRRPIQLARIVLNDLVGRAAELHGVGQPAAHLGKRDEIGLVRLGRDEMPEPELVEIAGGAPGITGIAAELDKSCAPALLADLRPRPCFLETYKAIGMLAGELESKCLAMVPSRANRLAKSRYGAMISPLGSGSARRPQMSAASGCRSAVMPKIVAHKYPLARSGWRAACTISAASPRCR